MKLLDLQRKNHKRRKLLAEGGEVLHLRGLIEFRVLILIEIGLVFSVLNKQRLSRVCAHSVACSGACSLQSSSPSSLSLRSRTSCLSYFTKKIRFPSLSYRNRRLSLRRRLSLDFLLSFCRPNMKKKKAFFKLENRAGREGAIERRLQLNFPLGRSLDPSSAGLSRSSSFLRFCKLVIWTRQSCWQPVVPFPVSGRDEDRTDSTTEEKTAYSKEVGRAFSPDSFFQVQFFSSKEGLGPIPNPTER